MSLLQADARRLPLADCSVQMCVTSPPYMGLRVYSGIQPGIWGGDLDCSHEWQGADTVKDQRHAQDRTFTDGGFAAWTTRETAPSAAGQSCFHCQAWKGMLGLEPDYRMFISHLVEVFAEVHRVLKPDGVCFLNIGDSMSGGAGGRGDRDSLIPHRGTADKPSQKHDGTRIQRKLNGIPAKNLMLIPQRLAIALQEWGWYVRAEIIWHKPNPMPESVRDRPTKAHEQVWMLTKRANYYWDADAIAEPLEASTIARYQTGWNGNQHRDYPNGEQNHFSRYMGSDKAKAATKRNKRSVWTIPTQAFPLAHFATYPEELVETCILAASRPGDVVLDPFVGSGTTVCVAHRLGRKGLGCDLSRHYLQMAQRRLWKQPIGTLFAENGVR